MLKRFLAWIGSLMHRRRLGQWGSTPTPTPTPSPTLAALFLSASTFTRGVSASGTIIGATALSTITGGSLPSGFMINGTLRTWAWDGSGSGGTSGSLTLTETLLGASNTPRNSIIGYAIDAAPSSITAPVLTQTSTAGTSPFTWDETLDATGTAGVMRHLQIASDSGFTTLLYDLYKPVLENEFNGDDTIWGSGTDNPPRDYTTDAFTYLGNLGGSIYVRERLERDDGVNSAWSNVLHDTITTVTGWKIVSHATSAGSNKGFALAECEFQDISSNPLTSGGTAFGADAGSTYVQASNAFDGSLSTYFLSPDGANVELGLTWSGNKDARKAKLTGAANDGIFDKRTAMPTNFDVYKQTGGSWVFVANFTDSGSTTDNQVRTYTW